MKISRDEFRKLRKHWYDKLEELGFKDSEKLKGDELILQEQKDACGLRSHDFFSMNIQEEYYRCFSENVNDENTVFRNQTDKFICLKHSEGMKIADIAKELTKNKIYKSRNAITFLIRKYEVAWSIKSYDPKKLNLKPK